jgi:transcriptional regulator with XRE-family HTH domain
MMRKILHERQILRRALPRGILCGVASLMTQTRKSRGLSLEKVAAAVQTDQTNLSRIERGLQVPEPDLACALFRFYDGVVSLDDICGPRFADLLALARERRRKSR